jgi:hypothetical protein
LPRTPPINGDARENIPAPYPEPTKRNIKTPTTIPKNTPIRMLDKLARPEEMDL